MLALDFQPFKAGHLRYLSVQPAQRDEHAIINMSEEYQRLMEAHFALSAWYGLECLGAAGVMPYYSHRAVAWLLLSAKARPFMLPIVRRVRAGFELLPYRRIELTVAADFAAGRHFAELVGMTCETPQPMRSYGAQGGDEYMYAMVK